MAALCAESGDDGLYRQKAPGIKRFKEGRMITRPLYSTRCIDTTPKGIRKERRTRHLRRAAYDILDLTGMALWMLFVVFVATEIIYVYGMAPR